MHSVVRSGVISIDPNVSTLNLCPDGGYKDPFGKYPGDPEVSFDGSICYYGGSTVVHGGNCSAVPDEIRLDARICPCYISGKSAVLNLYTYFTY